MAGFLPISIASNGTAPKAAPEAATSPTGAEGAFGAVLAGLMGDASLEGAAAADLVYMDTASAATKAASGFPQTADVDRAGSALQRLKLAFADAGTLPGRSSLNGSIASSMALLAAVPANTEADVAALPATAKTDKPIVDAPRAARKAQADVADADKPETVEVKTAETVEADAAVLLAAVTPAQSQQTSEPVSQPATGLGIDAAAGIATIEPAAGDTDATPRAEPARPDTANAETAKPEVEPVFEQRDLPTPQHDLSAVGQTRPLTATVTTLHTQPAQAQPTKALTNPSAGSVESVDAANAAALAVTAPTAGQTANTVRDAGAAQRRGAEAEKAETVADVMALMADTAPVAGAPALAVNAQAGQPEQILTSADLPAEAPAITLAAVQAQAAKPAGADKPVDVADMLMIEPAVGDTQTVTDAMGGERMAPSDETRAKAETGNTAQVARSASTADQQPVQPAVQTANQPAAQSAALPDGFQPVQSQSLHAQPLHSQTGSHSNLPHGADVVRAATPQQLPEAVGVAISRYVGAEATEFTLRLDPAELGRIEVKLEMGKDGQASVSIQADNASTFDLLRRDSSALERALADAGLKLDSGGLNFSLRQQDGQGQQQFNGEGGQRQATGRMQEASLAGPEQDNTPRPLRRSGAAGLLDLSI